MSPEGKAQSTESAPERCVCYDHPDARMIVRLVGRLPEDWQRRLIAHLSALYIDGRLNDGSDGAE